MLNCVILRHKLVLGDVLGNLSHVFGLGQEAFSRKAFCQDRVGKVFRRQAPSKNIIMSIWLMF